MRKKILLLFLSFLFFWPILSYAASNPYPKTQKFNDLVSTPCTRVAWQEAYDRLGIALPAWGNAINWYKNAHDAGYQVGSVAKPNSIAVYSGFYDYGHVAYVVEVYDDTMKVVENKGSGEGKIESTRSKGIGSGEESGLYLIGFIYITEPKESIEVPTTTKETITKSSNSYLKSLEITGLELNFQKDNYSYYVTVPYEVSKITVNGTLESSKAQVEGLKEYDLLIGENHISIKVIAEDKSTSIYNLIVTREEEIKEIEETKEPDEIINNSKEEEKSLNKNYDYLIYLLSGLVVLVIIIGLVIKLRKHKK